MQGYQHKAPAQSPNNVGFLGSFFLNDRGRAALRDPKISVPAAQNQPWSGNRSLWQKALDMGDEMNRRDSAIGGAAHTLFSPIAKAKADATLDATYAAMKDPRARQIADAQGDLIMGQVKRGLKKAAPYLAGGAALMMAPSAFNAFNQHRMASAMQQMARRPQMPAFRPPMQMQMQRPGGYDQSVFRLHGTYLR
jgi:hypothetical protein